MTIKARIKMVIDRFASNEVHCPSCLQWVNPLEIHRGDMIDGHIYPMYFTEAVILCPKCRYWFIAE